MVVHNSCPTTVFDGSETVMLDKQRRNCPRCGAGLARDNKATTCGPCSRKVGRPPRLRATDWRTSGLRTALRSKDIGAVLNTWRHHPHHGEHPVSQAQLARWLGITQGQLSRIENGRNKVRDLDKLVRYARALGIPPELLWFDIDDNPGRPSALPPLRLSGGTVPTSSAADTLIIDSLLSTLEAYVRTDSLAGPQSLVPLVTQQLQFVEGLGRTSYGQTQKRINVVHARFAEFLGWLHQDAGDLRAAVKFTTIAADLARETGERQLLSYVTMRQSNLAADAGKAHATIALARTALNTTARLTPRHRAAALRQLAQGYARLGHAKDATRALEQARQQASSSNGGECDLASYCTPEYIGMESAECFLELGRPDEALAVLEPQISAWKTENRRDLGRGLALLAVALAGTSRPDEAIDVARHALRIIAETRSVRAEEQLNRVVRQLHAQQAPDHARHLRLVIRNTLG